MSKSNPKPQTLGVLFLGLMACLAVVKTLRDSRESESAETVKPVHHQYRVDLIAETEATPGKVIRAKSPGAAQPEYRCSPQDAAVAIVYVTDSSPTPGSPTIEIGPAKDPEGHIYSTASHYFDRLIFVTIVKGFSKAPKSITFPVSVTEPQQFNSTITANYKRPKPNIVVPITVKKIVPPRQYVSVPSANEAKEAEKTAIAEYVESAKSLQVKVKEKAPPGFYAQALIVATSFSPEHSINISSETDGEQDAVKVRLTQYRRHSTQAVLTYNNAEIRTVNGIRLLVLPSGQTIGRLLGLDAFIKPLTESSFSLNRLKHSFGILAVRLPIAVGQHLPEQRHIESIDVSPSVDSMGLDWVQLSIDSLAYSTYLKPAGATKPSAMTVIPKLTLTIHLTNDVEVSSKDLTLPVHHVKDDPILFPPQRGGPNLGVAGAPTPTGPGGGAGAFGAPTGAPRAKPAPVRM